MSEVTGTVKHFISDISRIRDYSIIVYDVIVFDCIRDNNSTNKTNEIANISYSKRLSDIVRYKFDYNTKNICLMCTNSLVIICLIIMYYQ